MNMPIPLDPDPVTDRIHDAAATFAVRRANDLHRIGAVRKNESIGGTFKRIYEEEKGRLLEQWQRREWDGDFLDRREAA